jgi:hypothetical protein
MQPAKRHCEPLGQISVAGSTTRARRRQVSLRNVARSVAKPDLST